MVIFMQKLKRALCFCLALSMAVLLTGCRRNVGGTSSVESTSSVGGTTSTSSQAKPTASPSASPLPSAPGTGSGITSSALSDPAGSANGTDLQQLYDEVKNTYGEHYYPTRKLSPAELEETFGISTDLYSEFIADTSSGEDAPDTLVIIKALEGKEQEVEDKLNAHRETLLNDTKWEGSREKIEASRVYRNGAYVFYVMLGDVTDETLSGEGLMEALGKEIDKGIDAIENFLNNMM